MRKDQRSLGALVLVLVVGPALWATCGDVTANVIVPETEEEDPCNEDDQCSDERPQCVAGDCVECATLDDCASPDARFCAEDGGRCVECIDDGHCDEGNERCSTALGKCALPCTSGASCPVDDDPICDLDAGFCVECIADADCGEGNFCRASDCYVPQDD